MQRMWKDRKEIIPTQILIWYLLMLCFCWWSFNWNRTTDGFCEWSPGIFLQQHCWMFGYWASIAWRLWFVLKLCTVGWSPPIHVFWMFETGGVSTNQVLPRNVWGERCCTWNGFFDAEISRKRPVTIFTCWPLHRKNIIMESSPCRKPGVLWTLHGLELTQCFDLTPRIDVNGVLIFFDRPKPRVLHPRNLT